MQRALVGVLPLLASCMFIVPRDGRETVSEKPIYRAPVVVGRPIPELAPEPQGTALLVRGTWKRVCDRYGEVEVQQRVKAHAGFTWWTCGGGHDKSCELAMVFGILAAPVTLPVSGLVTLIVVATSDERRATTYRPLPVQRVACDQPGAGWRVIVSAPGRAPVEATLGADGTARVELGDEVAARAATAVFAR